MNKKPFVALCLLTALFAAGCAPVPVKNFNNVPIQRTDGKTLTLNDVDHAIRGAAAARNWQTETVSPGHIVATHNEDNGEYIVTLDITFTDHDFSIQYKNSQGMKYNAAKHTIRRNYNSWVTDLRDDIKNSLGLITPGS